MKAILQTKRGKNFSTMSVQEIASPVVQHNEVKVRVTASRINPVDMDLMKGFPTLKYKNPQIGGIDGSGTIIETGDKVDDFAPGDQVYFYKRFTDIGTWAEEITLPASDIAKIPEGMTLRTAGSIALPILTAYEAIKSLKPEEGASILIHGASGGVGFMAVQLAKHFGLSVISNANGKHESMLKEVGVERVIDYKSEDFLEALQSDPPDYVFDVIGKDTLLKSIRLIPQKVVSVAYPDTKQMHKTGVQLPGILRFLMNMVGRKFAKAAKKNNVLLLGQVTGPNGTHMREASQAAESVSLKTLPERIVSFSQISSNGLSEKDLGKTILFE